MCAGFGSADTLACDIHFSNDLALMHFEIVGINFQTAPLAVRERLAVNADELPNNLQRIQAEAGVSEVVVVSTCNRTEVICAGGQPQAAYNWLQAQLDKQQSSSPGLSSKPHSQTSSSPYFYQHDGLAAAKHLFRVIAGLDSMVLGEPQIHGQVKQAYQAARDASTLGPTLEKLFQRSFFVAKKIRSNTAIGELPVSVAYAAIQLAKRLYNDLAEHHVLLIGAGETSALLGRHLLEQGVKRFTVANRDLGRARNLAAELGGQACELNDLQNVLLRADMVFSSTAADHVLLDKTAFQQALKLRKRRPMFIVDLAVPRDIDAAVNELDDAYLYTVDDLTSVVAEGQQARQSAAQQAEILIEHEVTAYGEWLHSLTADDLIRQLRDHGETLRDAALARANKQLAAGQDPAEVLQQLATQLNNKWLHAPTMALRLHNDDATISDSARCLFGLTEQTTRETSEHSLADIIELPRRQS